MSDLKAGQVRVLKLVSGEEIVGTIKEVRREFDGNFLVPKVVVVEETIALVQQIDQTGRPVPSIFPWGNSTKTQKEISLNHVLYHGEPVDNLLEEYNRIFSKIQQPSKGLVLPE